jgi:hypothetical protein
MSSSRACRRGYWRVVSTRHTRWPTIRTISASPKMTLEMGALKSFSSRAILEALLTLVGLGWFCLPPEIFRLIEASNESLRKQHLAYYHQDCRQADRILRSLKSCTDGQMVEFANDVVLEMVVQCIQKGARRRVVRREVEWTPTHRAFAVTTYRERLCLFTICDEFPVL